MNQIFAPSQAHRSVEKLRVFCRRTHEEQQEAWKEHAETFPRLRIWLSNVAQPGRDILQNAFRVSRATAEYGPRVAARTDVPLSTQILQQLRLYNAHRVPPDCYYFLGMYKDPVRKKARFFLDDHSASTLLHQLASTAPNEEYEPLHEKRSFWIHCQSHDLPAVPALAIFENGSLQQDYAGINNTLPPQNLFSKPVTGFLGQGTQRWIYEEEDYYRDSVGRRYTPQALMDALKKQSEDTALLLQPCVRDHPQLRELTGRIGPSTVRIITIRKPGGPPEYLAGFLTTPLKDVSAPTFTQKTALAVRIDTDSGTLGPPLYKEAKYLFREKEQHPQTEKRMVGQQLPDWHEAKALALQAHATLPSIACVGWDVMLTPSGPLLLEGNYDCSAAVTQIAHQQLLGLTRFSEYMNAHVQRNA